MTYTLSHLWTRHRIGTLGLYMATLGLLSLNSINSDLQAAEPSTATQSSTDAMQAARERFEERRRNMGADMRAVLDAPRPPRVESRNLSADGKKAVSVSSDGKVTIWDSATGKDLLSIQAYEIKTSRFSSIPPYTAASFSPNGKLLWTLGQAELVDVSKGLGEVQGKMWDATTGKLLWTLGEVEGEAKSNYSLNTFAFSSDSKLIATKVRYGPIHLWNPTTGKLVRTLRVPFINMNALAFSPDGKTLAGGGYHSTSYRGEIMLWDVKSGELKQSLKQTDSNLGNQIQTVQFSPDGKTLVTGGGIGEYEMINDSSGRFNAQCGVAQLWDVKSGVMLFGIGMQVHRKLITTLTFSPDSKRLATGSYDQTVGLWDCQSGELLGSATRYGTESKLTTTETKEGEKGVQSDIVVNTSFNRSGVSGSESKLPDPSAAGTVKITRTQTIVSGEGVQDLVFSGDGTTLNILSQDKSVRAWDVSTNTPQSDPIRRFLPGSGSSYSSLSFGSNSRWLVSGEYSKRVRFWSTTDRKETTSFLAHTDPITKIALAPLAPDAYRFTDQAPLLATASNKIAWRKSGENSGTGQTNGFEVKLWDTQNREMLYCISMMNHKLNSLAISAGGQWVAAACETLPQTKTNAKGVVMLWDASNGELKHKIAIDGDIPTDLAFSPDGNLLAVDGNNAGVSLWNAATGTTIRTLDAEPPTVDSNGVPRPTFRATPISGKTTLAFSGDGTSIARSHNESVKFWNIETGALQSTITDTDVTAKFGSAVIALTPDGKTLAMAAPQQRLTLWDVASGKQLWKTPDSERQFSVSMLQISPNGKTLAASDSGEIRLLDITQVAQGIVK